ncbi:DUF4199 domain-containing protein [Lacinutrix sp. MedPE-SW]|uniref:DUF4199 domain-containing protein n=1 Tax=Lacinutrix sp. MedPE-SW TaxID=1860087 RepID=UPI000915A8BA|nr:DUF4199 domain-containing protein [Lacinutrix sp. MedPE-SW]OIQ22924.1 MAG: DUF4199 domain-containing protein [Lacinutrix sp. MedPE-SW]
METSTKSSAINHGLYLGGFLALVTILGYALYLDLLTKWWLGIIFLIVIIIAGIVSAIKSKKMQGGFITFKEAFSSYFITVAIGILISMVISIVIFNFIDPEAAITLKEKTIETTVQMMRNFNAPEDAVAQTVEQMEAQKNQFSIGPQLQSNVIFLVIQAVIGLIVALIVKRNPENA